MAGQENQEHLWGMSLGLDLLPPTVCSGFRTLLPASVQNLGSRNPCLTKLALDQAADDKFKFSEPCFSMSSICLN